MIASEPIDAALALHAAGEYVDAEAAYRDIIAADPLHVEAQHYLGVLLHQIGSTQEGLTLIIRALEADGGSAMRFNDMGNILVQAQDFTSAAEAFRVAIELGGDDANVWNNLGSVLHRQKNHESAETAYREALERDPDFVAALNNLAALLTETKREEEASLYSCRAFIQTPMTGKSSKMLGVAYYRLGRITDAAECYRDWLRREPDNVVARHLLSACTGRNVPARAPDDFLTAVFDDMADTFDEKMTKQLSYRGPEIIAELLDGFATPERVLNVLDGGCGTGLCAQALAPYAGHLVGVDLSGAMLAQARLRNLYSELVHEEITTYLLDQSGAFDLVVMMDSLIYFGELRTLFGLVRQALRPGGAFAFTLETTADAALEHAPYVLGPSGRYAHSMAMLEEELEAAGLAVLRKREVTLRNEFCRPVPGMGILAQIKLP